MSAPRCSVADCARYVTAKGLCDMHYMRLRRTGSLERVRQRHFCSEDGCDQHVEGRGLCRLHYERVRRAEVGRKLYHGRLCATCEGPIPPERNARAKFCSKRCKGRAAEEKYRKENAKLIRERAWLWRYGLTPEGYDALLAAQGGVCAICGGDEPGGKRHGHLDRTLMVDHCHDTNVVRGLLCSECNSAIGKFHDDVDLLRKAIVYLSRDVT